MSCSCDSLNNLKLLLQNTKSGMLYDLIKSGLDSIFLGEYIFPTFQPWLEDALDEWSKNDVFFYSEEWAELLASSSGFTNSEIAWKYQAEVAALIKLEQAVRNMMKETPYNIFLDYDAILDTIATRQNLIKEQKNFFYDLWAHLHSGGTHATRDEVDNLLNDIIFYSDNETAEAETSWSLPPGSHHLLKAFKSIRTSTAFTLGRILFDFLKENLLPTFQYWSNEVLDLWQENAIFFRSEKWIKELEDANTVKTGKYNIAMQYMDELTALHQLELSVYRMMEKITKNPFINYKEILDKIANRLDLIRAEKDFFL